MIAPLNKGREPFSPRNNLSQCSPFTEDLSIHPSPNPSQRLMGARLTANPDLLTVLVAVEASIAESGFVAAEGSAEKAAAGSAIPAWGSPLFWWHDG